MNTIKSHLYVIVKYGKQNIIEEEKELSDAQIRYIKYTRGGNFCLFVETLKGRKLHHFRYINKQNRDDALDRIIANCMSDVAAKFARRKAQKEFVPDVKLGDIFCFTWGYEQTNINFFQVVGVRGKMIDLKEIAQKFSDRDTGNSMSAYTLPIPDQFVEDSHFYPKGKNTLTKKALLSTSYGTNNITFNMPYGYLGKWDGQPEYASWYA